MAGLVDDDTIEVKPALDDSDSDDELDSIKVEAVKDEPTRSGSSSPSLPLSKIKQSRSSSANSIKSLSTTSTPMDKKGEIEAKIGGNVTLKMEPGQPPKLSRSASQKMAARPPQLFDHLPDSTIEATSTFAKMEFCTYSNKYLGYTEHAMECDCSEEWSEFAIQLCTNPCLP